LSSHLIPLLPSSKEKRRVSVLELLPTVDEVIKFKLYSRANPQDDLPSPPEKVAEGQPVHRSFSAGGSLGVGGMR